MSRLAVLTYADAPNPDGIPGVWPAEVRAIAAEEIAIFPWIAMTVSQYAAYRDEHQAVYDAWKYKRDLARMIAIKVDALWQAAYDYNFQFFSGGAYAQILELKLAGFPRALETQNWILTLWGDYYMRKYAATSAMTHEAVSAVSIDFSNHATPPWTVPQMLEAVPQQGQK